MKSKMTGIFEKSYAIYAIAALASIALSIWISYRETVINPDGICYLLSAQQMGVAGLKVGMHTCGQAKWPLYSALIAAFTSVTHASPVIAAHIIDGFFTLVSVLTFIAIVEEMGASYGVLCFAAVTILLAHDFNSVREYIVRDHGFYAFYLGSIFALLRYMSEPTWLKAFLWSASILLATLFRIEGAVFFLFVPLMQLFMGRRSLSQRLRVFLQLNTVAIVLGVGMVGWFVSHPQASLEQLGRVQELLVQATQGVSHIFSRWFAVRDGLINHVLDDASAREAGMFASLITIAGYFFNVIGALTPIYALLVLYAWVTRAAFWTRNHTAVVMSYLLINLIITLGFYAQHLFLSKRYLIALSLLFMLWVPYALDKLQRKSHRKYYHAAFTVAMVWVMVAAMGGIFEFGYSKSYIHKAGDWLAENVPKNASVYSNNIQVMYYSHHFDKDLFTKQPAYEATDISARNLWKQYDYLAILANHDRNKKTEKILRQAGLNPIKIFHNKRGDMVAVYRIRQENTL